MDKLESLLATLTNNNLRKSPLFLLYLLCEYEVNVKTKIQIPTYIYLKLYFYLTGDDIKLKSVQEISDGFEV